MACPTGGQLPVVSKQRAEEILATLGGSHRDDVLWRAFEWLSGRYPDLRVYTTETNLEYDEWMKTAIALETGILKTSPCPFYRASGCMVSADPCYDRAADWDKAPYGFLPTLLAIGSDRERVRRLIRLGVVADAKVVNLTRSTAFPVRTPSGAIATV